MYMLEEQSSVAVLSASVDTVNRDGEADLSSFTAPATSGMATCKSVVTTEIQLRSTDQLAQPTCSTETTTEKNSSVAAPRKRRYQPTITGTIKLKELSEGKIKGLSEGKIKEIDRLLVNCFAIRYVSFSLVEQKQFVEFVNALAPGYKLPSRKTLKNKLVNDRYLEIKNNIIKKLQECKYVALTADMWTSITTEGFLSVTAHFVQGGKLHTAVLATKQIQEPHLEENITCNIKAIIYEWEIIEVVALVTDNASVMADVANKLGIVHLRCAAHTLNLLVTEVISHSKLKDLALLRLKCKKLVTFFKSSTIGSSKLVGCQEQLGKTPLKLKQEVITRWDSTYLMMQRLVKVKEALIMSLSYVNYSESLTAIEWAILTDCVEILEPLFEMTQEMSEENYVGSSIMIPLVRGCQEAIRQAKPSTSTGVELKFQVLLALSRRMTPYETDTSGICAKATILDPRFKTLGFGQSSNATATVNNIILEVQLLEEHISQSVQANSSENKEKQQLKVWQFYIEERQRRTVPNPTSLAKELMKTYLSQPSINMINDDTDPFTHWRRHEDSFKALSSIAYKYLCVPATSVPSERVFSKTGEMYSELRSRLKATTVDEMIFLNANQMFGHE